MATRVTHVGFREAMRALKSLPTHMRQRCGDAIAVTADRFEREVERRVRAEAYRTGDLYRAVASRVNKRAPSAVVGVEKTTPLPFYWKFLEYGTKHMEARPIWRPVAEAIRNQHKERMDQALGKAGQDILRKGGIVT